MINVSKMLCRLQSKHCNSVKHSKYSLLSKELKNGYWYAYAINSVKFLCADMINVSKMSCRLQSKRCNSVKHWSQAFKKIRCLVDKVGISEENSIDCICWQ